MDLRQVFAANLRRLRHAKGLSQEDLAYEADVNRSYMSKLEKRRELSRTRDHRETRHCS
jgi:transcriptional regulator with XRE-family HTH domain